jgi:VWFA-related protein
MKRVIALFLATGLTVCTTLAQTPINPETPQTGAAREDIIRITTSLVQTDVVITDKNDRIIPDLKLEDFKVYENGKKQELKFLEFVSGEAQPRVEGDIKIAGQALESEISRNLSATDLRRVFAFVVDDLTVPSEDVGNVRRLLTNFLDNQMRGGDLVAIVRVVGGSGFLQQFTSDKRILRRAIAQITPQLHAYSAFNNLVGKEAIDTQLNTAVSEAAVSFPADAISAANTNIDSSDEGITRGFRALSSLQTASDVTNSMRTLPGRKSLVLISGGLPLSETTQNQVSVGGAPVTILETRSYLSNMAFLLRQLVDRAGRAGVVINTLDIRGLNASRGVSRFADAGNEPTSAFGPGRSGFGRTPNMAEFDNLSLDTMSGHMGLAALSQATGGISVTNAVDFSDGLNKIVARSSYYLLAYAPTEQFDGKFHKLEIKVIRPGARVYAREGYYAKADEQTGSQTREDAIVKAAMSPLSKREVELGGRIEYRFSPDNTAEVDVNLLINANNLSFKQDSTGKYESTLDVVGFVINSLGKRFGGFSQTIHSILSPEEYRRALTTGIGYTRHGELPPGSYQLRAVVRDAETGRVGSLSQYIEVPNLAKKHLAASSLFLYAVSPDPGSRVPPDPLTALRLLPRKQDLRYAAIIYNSKGGDGKGQLKSQVIISRDGKIIYLEPEASMNADVRNGQVIKLGQFGLGKSAGGRYVLTLVITDPQADKQDRTIVRSIDFTLVD